MKINFRQNQIYDFFETYNEVEMGPLDLLLSRFLKGNKSIGSHDRKMIVETVYSVVRNLSLLDSCLERDPTWEERVHLFLSEKLSNLRATQGLHPFQRLSLSEELYQALSRSLTEEEIESYAQIINQRAPTTVRVNLLKTSRESLWNGWKDRYDISLCKESPTGIVFNEKINFPVLSEFQKGLFEIQDEASQIVSHLVQAQPGQEFLDYCAGAGGKSLAIATGMENRGQMFLHDIREKALFSAKKRLKRAGVQNAQTVYNNPSQMKRMKNRMDWVLVDVPCSGSGTWRRNPDQKWKFSLDMLSRIANEQREIFEEALKYLGPKGKIIYATCSVFPEENEEQVAYFLDKFNLVEEPGRFKCFPEQNGKDGFFAAIFSFKS